METSQPVIFGESFGQEQPTASYHSFQYNFKPQSACHGRVGSLNIEHNSVTLRRSGTSTDGHASNVFEGQWAPAQQETECIAIFENGQWRLETLAGTATNLRHTSVSGKMGSPAPRSPPPSQSIASEEIRPADARPSPRPEEEVAARALSPELPSHQNRLPSSVPSSVTPSVTGPPSHDTSLSDSQAPLPSAGVQQLQREELAATVAGLARSGVSPGRSPSVTRPPNSSSKLSASSSSSSSSSSSDEEEEVTKPPTLRTAQVPADVPDFEREFFEGNSEDDAASSSDSESSGNTSEEEAKHF